MHGGEGNYFQEMICDYSTVDDPRNDFGSTEDFAISAILSHKEQKMSSPKDKLPNTPSPGKASYIFDEHYSSGLNRDFNLNRFK